VELVVELDVALDAVLSLLRQIHALLMVLAPAAAVHVYQLPLMRVVQDVVYVVRAHLLVAVPDVVHAHLLVAALDVVHAVLLDVEPVADVAHADLPLSHPPNQWESTTQLISTTQ